MSRRTGPSAGTLATAPERERAAFGACERITRTRAKNFSYGIRLLPPEKRAGLSTVYAVARRVDDIGDGVMPPEEKLRRLERVRREIDGARADAADPVLAALAMARERFGLPIASFHDLVDGVESDVRWRPFRTMDDTVTYCRRVAGSIGRLSVAVFGSTEPERAAGLGDDLGVAMQLTNILRDLREDAALGRCYLPAEHLAAHGCRSIEEAGPEALAALVRAEVRTAREWFARGLALLPLLDHRSAACVGAMTGIYRRVLSRIEADPAAALSGRICLPVAEKAWVAARSLVGAIA